MRYLAMLLALAACAWAPAGLAATPSPHAIDIPKWFTESFLDFREDVRDAAKENKRVMIYFGQDGCPYCKALMKGNFGQADIAATTRKHFVAIALNLWGDREVTWVDGRSMPEKALAKALEVQYTPTLLFLDEKGEVALRLNGYLPPERFRVALDYASRRLEKRQSFTEYMAARAPLGGRLAPQAFFERGTLEFPRLLKTAGKPVLVLFEQKSCRECDELHKEGLRRPEVRALLGRFAVVQLDLAGARALTAPDGNETTEAGWAGALKLAYAPSLVFLDAAGKEVFRAEGYLKPFHLASVLEYVASGAYRQEPSFQRFIQKRADALRARGEAVELW